MWDSCARALGRRPAHTEALCAPKAAIAAEIACLFADDLLDPQHELGDAGLAPGRCQDAAWRPTAVATRSPAAGPRTPRLLAPRGEPGSALEVEYALQDHLPGVADRN